MTETTGQINPSPIEEAEADVLTFLIADVRGYTRYTQERGDEAAALLAEKFAELTREDVVSHGGRVIELRGDEVLAAFSSARRALRAAVDLQSRIAREIEVDPTLPLGAGIGLDVGEAVPVEGGYRGGAVNLAARLCDLAAPGEILASEAVVHLARRLEGLTYTERGTVSLKGFAEPVKVILVSASQDAESGELHDAQVSPAEQRLPLGGFLGALPEGHLVARDHEMQRLRGEIDAVERSAGRLVLLAGEAGAGKTRLAQEVTLEARNRGFLVAAGSCYSQRQATPFYPFLEALPVLYAALPPAIRSEAPRRWSHVGRLLPDAGIPIPPPSADGLEEGERLFRAVSELLEAAADAAPVLLAFDDLHWADDSSLDLLRHLARRTRASRVLILGVYRDGEIERGHPLEGTLLELHRQQLVSEVAVHRLNREGTAALVAETVGEGDVPAGLVELLYRRTDGNPFFVRELVRTLVERGDLYRQNGRWQERSSGDLAVPERVRAVVEQRLARLTEGTREILREASVLGQTFSFEDLQEMRRAGAPRTDPNLRSARLEDEIESALEEASASGLVQETERDRYAFHHTLTREVLYDDLPGRRRRRLHRAAAEALERGGEKAKEERAAELAWHYLRADEAERALPHAILAGDRAEAVFAHSEAERLYRMALSVAWEMGETAGSRVHELEAQALEKLGGVLRTVGRYDEALDYLERAARSYGEIGDRDSERRAVASIGSVHAYTGKIDEGIARLLAAVGAPERGSRAAIREMRHPPTPRSPLPISGGSSSASAALYTSLAQLFTAGGRYPEGLATAERAVEFARRARDDRALAEAEVRRAEALAALGRHEEARRTLEEIVPLAEAEDVGTLFRALNVMGMSCVSAGEFEQARAYHERALPIAEQLGDPRGLAFTLANLARAHYLLGDWDRVAALLQRAGQAAEPLEASDLAIYVQLLLGQLSAARGEWEEAERVLSEATRAAERREDREMLRLAHVSGAMKELLQGQPEAASRQVEPFLGDQDAASLLLLAQACVDLGDVARAESLGVQAFGLAASRRNRVELGEALWVQGVVRSRQERWEEAERLFESALALALSMPYPHLEGRILCAQGAASVARGAARQGSERIERALTIFRRLGARPHIKRAERALSGTTG